MVEFHRIIWGCHGRRVMRISVWLGLLGQGFCAGHNLLCACTIQAPCGVLALELGSGVDPHSWKPANNAPLFVWSRCGDDSYPWKRMNPPWGNPPWVHAPWTMPWSMAHGPWTMVQGPWSMDHGPQTMVHGPWSMDHDPWAMVHGP